MIRTTMTSTPRSPLPNGVTLLTWSGVLPFAASLVVALTWHSGRGIALAAFIGYGAVILSFLGGARWGRGLGAGLGTARYVESVMPSLLGFAALLIAHQAATALLLLLLGFITWLAIDLRDPLWSAAYKRLRLGITAVVVVLHVAWLFLL